MDTHHPSDTEWSRALSGDEVNRSTATDYDESCNGAVVPDEQVDIAILGGGQVGLAVAIGLTRRCLPEFKIRVYERAPKLRTVSQGILSISPNGLTALENLHPQLPEKVEAMGCFRRALRKIDIREDGVTEDKTIENYGEDIRDKYGRYKVAITWHNLQHVLANILDNPNEIIRTNHSLVSFTEEKDAVVLHFENRKSVRAKVVIACDGIYSAARRQMIKDCPIYFGQINWDAVIETKQLPAHIHPATGAVQYYTYQGASENDNGTSIPRWTSMVNDAGNGFVYWLIRVSDPVKALSLSGSHGRGGLGLPGVKESLLRLASPSPDIQAVIQAIPEGQIFERAIVGLMPAKTWRSNNGLLVLCGDSAHGMHPTASQGINTAFGSVDILVQEMERHQPNWKLALESYEMKRKATADIVQRFSNALGILESSGSHLLPATAIRDMMHWIIQNDPQLDPPHEVVDFLMNFDPVNEPGVSLLW